jgi:hypothetical protein
MQDNKNASSATWWNTLFSPKGETSIWQFLFGQVIIFGLVEFLHSLHQYIGFISSSWIFDTFGILFSAITSYLSYLSFLKRLRFNRWNNIFNLTVLVLAAFLWFFLKITGNISVSSNYVTNSYTFLFIIYFYLLFFSFFKKRKEESLLHKSILSMLVIISCCTAFVFMMYGPDYLFLILLVFLLFSRKDEVNLLPTTPTLAKEIISASLIWLFAFSIGPTSFIEHPAIFGTDVWLRHHIDESDIKDSDRIGALQRLAGQYAQGLHGEINNNAAITLYQRSYDAGSADSAYYLALLYHGMGNETLAKAWYEKSAVEGIDAALEKMGKLSVSSTGNLSGPADLRLCQFDLHDYDWEKCHILVDSGKMRAWAINGNTAAQCIYSLYAHPKDNLDNGNWFFWQKKCAENETAASDKAIENLADVYFLDPASPNGLKQAVDFSFKAYKRGAFLYMPRYLLLKLIITIRGDGI